MTKKITVVTTVYNDGQYLPDIMDCLADQTTEDFDWLILDDNSSDPFTLQLLAQIAETVPDVTVLTQDPAKKGVGYADQTALQQATGEYILVLESDDKIAPTYLEKAARVLDENPTVGVVYGRAMLFGPAGILRQKHNLAIPAEVADEQLVETEWQLPAYHFPAILTGNTVFISAMYRRADYLATLGYSGGLVGFQDFDLWLSMTELALQRKIEPDKFFYQLPEVVYYYRQRAESLTSNYSPEDYINSYSHIYQRHKQLFNANIEVLFDKIGLLAGVK